MNKLRSLFLVPCFSFLLTLLAACSPVSPSSILFPTRNPTASVTASSTVVPTPTFTPIIVPTSTFTPTRTPPVLPGLFQTTLQNPVDPPHTYIQDSCQYLRNKWSSVNSAPGTVVMVIMFHSITNKAVTSPDQISEYNFRLLMDALHDKGFQAITTTQMLAFMESNVKIPEHSVLLVVDDRKPSTYYDAWFRGYWEKWGWPVVNAWLSTDLSTADLWQQQVDLENEGWVDHQAHGFQHFPIVSDSSDDYIMQELQKPIEAFQEHFNKVPIAFFWPGGNFTPHAVQMARQFGYRLGFTDNARGPLMFNWIPLGDETTPVHPPSWIPEGPVNDPLMVLPRYWDTDAIIHLEQVMQIGQEAAAYAQANQSTELDYYDIVCSPAYGPIP